MEFNKLQVMLEDILQKYLFNYQEAVNEDRAIPESTTGLKPVHRRILWACYAGGFLSNKEYKKSARIVGDVMGKFHPHGDTSIYDAMIRLGQFWKMRYPLMDIHGNMGNIDGDGPAAMRYTNARLGKLAEEGMLIGMKKNIVDFIPNYDEDEEEPISLNSVFPNLLCNPNDGIGWAMACEWLPHNLKDVRNAIVAYTNGEEPNLPGPDFPTGGEIINAKEMKKCYLTGKGTVRFRARCKFEKDNIVFYEIPYGVTTEDLIKKIITYAKDNLPEVNEVVNESTKEIRLVIKCDKGANLNSIVSKLYAKTPLQNTASFNQVALVNGKPKLINLKECIEIYVAHNINCIVREAQFDYNKTEARIHILEGLIKALEDIDNIIALIKGSASATVAKTTLMQNYNFTEAQAKAILDMKLAKLAKLEKVELEKELAELKILLAKLEALINNRDEQIEELLKRLNYIVDKYGDDRRTALSDIEIPKTKAEKEIVEVIPEDIVISVSQTGLVKRVPKISFKVQKRAGKGVKSTDDTILDVISTNTVDTLMFFTTAGKMYKIVADKVPETTNAGRGVLINDLIKLESGEKVIAVSSLHRKSTPKFIIFITKNGMIKKSYLSEYTQSARSGGMAAIKVKDNDEVNDILFQDEEDVIMVSEKGMCVRISTKDITPVGRVAMGIKGIKLNEGDAVTKSLSVHKETDRLAVFCSNGLGKKIDLSDISVTNRNTKGVIIYKTDANEYLAGAALVSDDDNILICGKTSSICISASEIPLVGKTAAGNILIKNQIKSITKI